MRTEQVKIGDCLNVLKTFDDNSIDSIVTDPPYGLSFMGKRWDYDVPSVAVWCECLRVLKHGGHLLSFAGSRTYHRMAVNIEDAGFEIRDQIMWVYGSGFPKSLNIGKAVDKKLGNKRIDLGTNPNQRLNTPEHDIYETGIRGKKARITKGDSEWEGWGTALKPAHEPIVMARKPLSEKTIAKNVLKWGTGGINIDGCRVRSEIIKNEPPSYRGKSGEFVNQHQNFTKGKLEYNRGRFPANFIHDGSDEVVGLFPKQSGRFFYCPKANKKEKGEGNNHPTVKPLALMRYLCRLVTPASGVILDPFMGSGTTGLASKAEGFGFVGIEREADYVKIAKERMGLKRCEDE